MTAANTDHTNLSAIDVGGVVREDVMDKIWDISRIPLPFTDLLSSGTHGNQYVEYTTNELPVPATDNAVIDGDDIDQNDSVLGTRLGNYTQTSVKSVQISTRANASNSIGRMGSLSYQIAYAQQQLRRDVEAQMLSNLPSVAGDGTTTAGQSAGLGAWIATNTAFGGGGSAGGYNTTTGVIDAATPGTARALTETLIRDIAQAVYEQGGETMYLMGTPAVIRNLSEYLFTSSARIATMTNDNASGTGAMTAYGSANVFVTDFGQVLKLIPNRLQPQTDTDVSTLYFLDPKHLRQSFMRGYRTEPLAKTGLSEKRMISVDYSLLCLNEKSQGAIYAIDETAAVTG